MDAGGRQKGYPWLTVWPVRRNHPRHLWISNARAVGEVGQGPMYVVAGREGHVARALHVAACVMRLL